MAKTKTTKATANTAASCQTKFIHRIDALVEGKSTSEPGYGTVKCICSAKAAKNRRRQFSLTGSKVARNRRGYTFSTLMEALGLHR